MLLAIRDASGWNDTLERWEGSLLGYAQQENDEWLAYRKSIGQLWGFRMFWRVLSASERSFVENSGYRALPPITTSSVTLFQFPESMIESGAHLQCLGVPEGSCLAKFFLPFPRLENFIRWVDRNGPSEHLEFDIPQHLVSMVNFILEDHIEIVDHHGYDAMCAQVVPSTHRI